MDNAPYYTSITKSIRNRHVVFQFYFLKQLNLNGQKISTLMVKICKQRYDDVMWRHSYFVKKSQTQCQTDSLRLKLKVVFCTSNGSGTTWNPGFGFFTRNPGIGFFTQNLRLEKHLLLNKDFHYLFFCKNLAGFVEDFLNRECAKDPTKF